MFKQNDIANLKNIIWAIEKIEKNLINVTSSEELVQNEEKFDSVIVKLMNKVNFQILIGKVCTECEI